MSYTALLIAFVFKILCSCSSLCIISLYWFKCWYFCLNLRLFNFIFLYQIGRFFGEIDPSLMRHLVNISVYAFNKSYDYQSVCEPGAAPKQGAGHRSAYVVSNIQSTHPFSLRDAWCRLILWLFLFYFIAINSRHLTHWLVGHCSCMVS